MGTIRVTLTPNQPDGDPRYLFQPDATVDDLVRWFDVLKGDPTTTVTADRVAVGDSGAPLQTVTVRAGDIVDVGVYHHDDPHHR